MVAQERMKTTIHLLRNFQALTYIFAERVDEEHPPIDHILKSLCLGGKL